MGISLKCTISTFWIWIVWYQLINGNITQHYSVHRCTVVSFRLENGDKIMFVFPPAEIAEHGLLATRTMSANGYSRVPTALELFFNDILSRLRQKFVGTPTQSVDTKAIEWTADQLEDVLKAIAVELLQCRRLNDVSGFLDRVGALVARALYERTTTTEPCGCTSEDPAISDCGRAESKTNTVNVKNRLLEKERPRLEGIALKTTGRLFERHIRVVKRDGCIIYNNAGRSF